MTLTNDQIKYLGEVISNKKKNLRKRQEEVIQQINCLFEELEIKDEKIRAEASEKKKELIERQEMAFVKAMNKLDNLSSDLISC